MRAIKGIFASILAVPVAIAFVLVWFACVAVEGYGYRRYTTVERYYPS